jgi:type I restriction enzyme M protein
VRDALFAADRPGYSRLRVPPAGIKAIVFGHPEFAAFTATITARFDHRRQPAAQRLRAIAVGDHPKALIATLSEDLLQAVTHAPLLDPYDLYQRLMDYWAETMQDDVYLLAQEGWRAVLDGKPNTDLIPQSLVIRRYLAA